jgi:hypothetical protein
MKFGYPVDPRTPVTFTFAEHVAYKAQYGLQYYNGQGGPVDISPFTVRTVKSGRGGARTHEPHGIS